jgi:alpha-tubulin suppressor-like RCC1 family protein
MTIRSASCMILLQLLFTYCFAQNSKVGDGFGGRLWYRPYNYAVGSYSGRTVCGPEKSLYSWGFRSLGDTITNSTNGIYKAVGLDSVEFYTSGYSMAAIRSDKSGWYWDDINFTYPKKVIDSVVFADAASFAVSYIKLDSTVWTVGYNLYGMYGNAASTVVFDSVPQKMKNITNAVRVAVGEQNIYILTGDGKVYQTGVYDYNTQDYDSLPIQVPLLQNIVDIKATTVAVAALDNLGNVFTWGNGLGGSLGVGYDSFINTPVKVDSLKNIIALSGSCDGFSFFALDKDSVC